MTTIAYRDGVLAADTGVTSGGSYSGRVNKIQRVGNILVGACGTAKFCHKFHDYVRKGMRGNPPIGNPNSDDHGYMGILIMPGGIVVDWEDDGWATFTPPAYGAAWGAGSSEAKGALMAGASAIRAIEIACALDYYTHEPITYVSHRGA